MLHGEQRMTWDEATKENTDCASGELHHHGISLEQLNTCQVDQDKSCRMISCAVSLSREAVWERRAKPWLPVFVLELKGQRFNCFTLPLGGGSAPDSLCSSFSHSKSFEKQESLALSQTNRVVQVRNIETYCSDEMTSYIILKSTGLFQLFLSGSFLGFF